MATHSSILACKSSCTEEPGMLQPMGGHKRVGHNLATKQHYTHTHTHTHVHICILCIYMYFKGWAKELVLSN